MAWLHCDKHNLDYPSTSSCKECKKEHKRSLEDKIHELEEKLVMLTNTVPQKDKVFDFDIDELKRIRTQRKKRELQRYEDGYLEKLRRQEQESIKKITSHGTLPKGFTENIATHYSDTVLPDWYKKITSHKAHQTEKTLPKEFDNIKPQNTGTMPKGWEIYNQKLPKDNKIKQKRESKPSLMKKLLLALKIAEVKK